MIWMSLSLFMGAVVPRQEELTAVGRPDTRE